MTIKAQYLGMPLDISELDAENLEYFRYCAHSDFRLQTCTACGLLRYPPTTTCPWCANPGARWTPVERRGTVHSYAEVHHAIQPAFREHAPYLVLLVDLDTQKGVPTTEEALRIVGNLTTADGVLAPPELVGKVGIGTRVRMVFTAIAPGLALPQWTFDEAAQQPAAVWRYPED
jgi:uncharacterized OB-fold protein